MPKLVKQLIPIKIRRYIKETIRLLYILYFHLRGRHRILLKEEQNVSDTFFEFLEAVGIRKIQFSRVDINVERKIRSMLMDNSGGGVEFESSVRKPKKRRLDCCYIMNRKSVKTRNWNECLSEVESGFFCEIGRIFLKIPFEQLLNSAQMVIGASYQSIALLITNDLAVRIFEYLRKSGGNKVFPLRWEDIKRVESYPEKIYIELNETVDVVISFELGMSHTEVYNCNIPVFHLPFHNMFCGDCSRYCGYRFEEDICNNIIPELLSKNVKILAIEDVQRGAREFRFKHSKSLGYSLNFDNTEVDYKGFLEGNFDINDILNGQVVLQNNYIAHQNYVGCHVHWNSGERYTVYNNYREKRTIYFFGPCIASGAYVTDEHTIESYLRKAFGEDSNFMVRNFGGVWEWMPWVLRDQIFVPGDIVVIFSFDSKPYEKAGLKMVNVDSAYYSLGDELPQCVWDNFYHCNYKVNDKVAGKLYEILKENGYLKMKSDEDVIPFQLGFRSVRTGIGLTVQQEGEIEEWVSRCKRNTEQKKTGAIVMNCNPMTKGHEYLIRYAADCVEHLYVFILEEDKSVFKFQDRIRLVQEAVCDLEHVYVVPSGQFIISSSTMPGYFEKSSLQDAQLDAAYDLCLFSMYIAPAFGITVRFAGEEPFDRFTAQYNDTMKKRLPLYGIKFCEIPRRELNGQIVSATNVRNCIKSGEWKTIKELVPDNVFSFLEKNYRKTEK